MVQWTPKIWGKLSINEMVFEEWVVLQAWFINGFSCGWPHVADLPIPPVCKMFWQNFVIFKASTTFFSRKLAFRWDLSSALKREKNSIPLKRTNDFFAKESWPSCCEENVPSKSEIAQKLLSTTLSRSHNSIHWANLQYLLVYRGNHVL